MATFGGMVLVPVGESASGGGVFYLLQPSAESAIQALPEDAELELMSGVRAVVVRGVAGESYDEALEQGLLAVQKGLDLLSARGVASAAVADVEAKHLVWWVQDGVAVVRFWGVARTGFRMGATGVVLIALGTCCRLCKSPIRGTRA
jgi:hypothetical protein